MGWWSGRGEGGNKEILRSITAIELRLGSLEVANRSIRLEWENVYDKLMKAAARLNARNRRETADDVPPEVVTPAQIEAVHSGLATHDALAAARGRRGGA